MPPRRPSKRRSNGRWYVLAALGAASIFLGLHVAVRASNVECTMPAPTPFDRTQGCSAEPEGIAQDSDGYFYFVRRCADGTALMIPVPGMPPDKTPRAKPDEKDVLL